MHSESHVEKNNEKKWSKSRDLHKRIKNNQKRNVQFRRLDKKPLLVQTPLSLSLTRDDLLLPSQ